RSLDTGQDRRPLLRRDGRWFAASADDGLTASVPVGLMAAVHVGKPSVQRIVAGGATAVVVGVPLPRVNADFYEVASLSEAQHSLQTLAGTLAAVAIGATLAAAALSMWSVRRLLRPLAAVTTAARRISGGDLSARIGASGDPDLMSLTASFNAMVTEVTERIQRDQRFAADVSHELRSPLQTLTAASSVLQNRRGELDARTGAAAGMVAEEVARFTTLVKDLLELAREETPVVSAPTDVEGLLLRLCLRKGLPRQALDVESGLPAWPLDPRRVERILDNLVDNAVQHGGGLVRLGARTSEGLLLLEVDDAGPGVPEEERSLVFDRFGRGRGARTRATSDGTGLGLSLVARHAAAHHGRVSVLDRPGGGARFLIELPWTQEYA
ncbi:MAG TPA: HAMP domain-containing sensor histidine kinase, partial [Mycobacteriales bacterium]|nr:HAMP domain-containing sensor histidine kinase [Mycobacteriales bacterium]